MDRSTGSLRRLLLRWETLLVMLIVVASILNTRLSPYFLDVSNLLRTTSDFMSSTWVMPRPKIYF